MYTTILPQGMVTFGWHDAQVPSCIVTVDGTARNSAVVQKCWPQIGEQAWNP